MFFDPSVDAIALTFVVFFIIYAIIKLALQMLGFEKPNRFEKFNKLLKNTCNI